VIPSPSSSSKPKDRLERVPRGVRVDTPRGAR
jgi:hypothetical protein